MHRLHWLVYFVAFNQIHYGPVAYSWALSETFRLFLCYPGSVSVFYLIQGFLSDISLIHWALSKTLSLPDAFAACDLFLPYAFAIVVYFQLMHFTRSFDYHLTHGFLWCCLFVWFTFIWDFVSSWLIYLLMAFNPKGWERYIDFFISSMSFRSFRPSLPYLLPSCT